MKSRTSFRHLFRLVLPMAAAAVLLPAAGYNIRPWKPAAIEAYPAKMTSEGVTIAVEPLFTDSLAARVFDCPDMLARGIMPLAVIICNTNAFPVEVDGPSIELQWEQERHRSVDPLYAVQCLYDKEKGKKVVRLPLPIPPIKIERDHAEACQDFRFKYLGIKRVEPNVTAGGFLFIHLSNPAGIRDNLESAKVYVPNIYNGKTGSEMLFFEFDLKPAVDAVPKK